MMKCEEHGQLITGQTLESPVEVFAADVTFEHCKFIPKDPQHTLLTTGERTTVRDCDFLGDHSLGARRGIAVNSAGVKVLQSRFRNIFHAQDAQCVAGWDGTLDLLVEDCYGEASGENFCFGGSDAQSEDRVPTNIVIRRCYWTKQVWWKSKPNGATIKNSGELKNVRNFLMEDCDLSYSWTDGQTGFGFVMTVRNQDGANPYATIEDVTIRRTVIRDCEQGIQILGRDDSHPSQTMKRVNLEKVRVTWGGGNGVQLGNAIEGLSFSGCDFWGWGSKWLAFNNAPISGFVVTDTNANECEYGILGRRLCSGYSDSRAIRSGCRFHKRFTLEGSFGSQLSLPSWDYGVLMTISTLITLIIIIVIVGLAVYLVETMLPIAAPFKMVIRVLAVLAILLYLLRMLGTL